jgi:DNA invertase Pin-like site-specific DNA recombinase
MPGPRQHVIGYGRVSTEEQESNYSMDAQRSRFETLCKQNRWQSLGFFPETGSGTSVINRPVLCNILQRIQQGGVDALWVKETDRLSRPENLGDLSLISQTLESSNTLLMVDTRSMDLREDNSVLMLDFEGVLAKHFRRQLLRNMNRGKVRKAEMGRKAGGADIYGYRTNENGEYVPVPEQAKVVQLIYQLTLKDYTLRQVRAELKRRGIRTARDRESWSIAVLGDMLRNDIYLGVYRFHKSKHGKDVDGSRYTIRRNDQIVTGSREKPNHPPIIEPWVFDVVQQKIIANRTKNSVRLHMATGLLRCPGCSKPMHVKYSTISQKISKRGQIEKYVCANRPHCPSKRIAVAETNDALWGALVQLLIKPERIHALIAPAPGSDPDALKKELAVVEREEKTAKEKQQRLLDLYLEGNLPQASYVVKSSELETQLSGLAARKLELRKLIDGRGKTDLTTELIQTLRILARSHRRLTAEQKTTVFRSIVKEARLTAAGVELELYVQPTQNIWWKYRQKKASRSPQGAQRTVRIRANPQLAVGKN